MSTEELLFESKEIKTSDEVAQLFRQIAGKLEAGKLKLQNRESEVDIEFPEKVKFEIKHEEEHGNKLERSFKIKMKWIVGEKSTGETKIL